MIRLMKCCMKHIYLLQTHEYSKTALSQVGCRCNDTRMSTPSFCHLNIIVLLLGCLGMMCPLIRRHQIMYFGKLNHAI